MGTPMVARCSFGSIQRSSANAAPPETGRLKLRLFLAPREHSMLPRSCWCCCLSLSGGGGSSKNILPPLKRVGNHTETSGKLAVFDLLPGREVADDFFEVLALLQAKLLSTCDKFKLYFSTKYAIPQKSSQVGLAWLNRISVVQWLSFPPPQKTRAFGHACHSKAGALGFSGEEGRLDTAPEKLTFWTQKWVLWVDVSPFPRGPYFLVPAVCFRVG